MNPITQRPEYTDDIMQMVIDKKQKRTEDDGSPKKPQKHMADPMQTTAGVH
jgi:hypothetical protein